MSLFSEIETLKKEKNAIILAHYYVPDEVQVIADFVGDSFALAKKAKETDAKIIVFAGVLFMAESAKLLNPDKKVIKLFHDQCEVIFRQILNLQYTNEKLVEARDILIPKLITGEIEV